MGHASGPGGPPNAPVPGGTRTTGPSGARTGDGEVMGVIEDDRIRAVVTTTRQRTVVTLEGELDGTVAPVLDELLDAVDRWHTRASRIAERDEPPTLLLDAAAVERVDDAGWEVLEGHRERWERRRGPCVTRRPRAQGSRR